MQDNQLNENAKKALTVIFYTGKGINANEDIIDANNYLNKENLAQNKKLID